MAGCVPQVSRVFLRIEWADGQVWEVEAEAPDDLLVSIERSYDRLALPPLSTPDMIAASDDALGVSVTFKASRDRHKRPLTIRAG